MLSCVSSMIQARGWTSSRRLNHALDNTPRILATTQMTTLTIMVLLPPATGNSGAYVASVINTNAAQITAAALAAVLAAQPASPPGVSASVTAAASAALLPPIKSSGAAPVPSSPSSSAADASKSPASIIAGAFFGVFIAAVLISVVATALYLRTPTGRRSCGTRCLPLATCCGMVPLAHKRAIKSWANPVSSTTQGAGNITGAWNPNASATPGPGMVVIGNPINSAPGLTLRVI